MRLQANHQGWLVIREGCLLIGGLHDASIVIWPSPGTQWDPATGTVTLDGVSAKPGDEVVLAGGETDFPGPPGAYDWVSEPPQGCLGYPHAWLTWELTVVPR
ncbi:MAG TPA: hypothetical protein VFI15_10590 [Candidatus Limnocylindrales bacterium]|nr:hypothetical protein [Candidatus Limnocylindrales bacterium]